MRFLLIAFLLLGTADHCHGRNFIRYHQKSLIVQAYMLAGDHAKALVLLRELERRYGLMPTETFARALCLGALGDTATARQAYLRSIEQRASLGWVYAWPPWLRSVQDTLWYNSVIAECEAAWSSRPQYADGPNPGIPTPTSSLNARHQFVIDSLGFYDPLERPEAQQIYDRLIQQHDLKLDSMLHGLLPVPSIADYGINQEFEMFLLHTSASLKYKEHRIIKRWLEQGLIYPCTYAVCFDDLANEENRPIPYGIFDGLRPEEREPGHEERRAAIGMGDEQLEKLRFRRGG